MSNQNAARFFDTSGCLNLSRPTSGTRITSSAKQYKRPSTSSGLIRGQIKIDLYNFDHIDFADSKYVLTSPRSLEACARLNLKPATLLPKKLADLTSDKVRFSTLVDVHDEMEIDRLANLQRCRDEREKIIREETFPKSLSTKLVDSKTKSNPSNSHLHNHVESRLPPRPPSSSRLTTTNLTWKTPDDRNELRISASANFLDDVRRMDKSLQRKGTSDPNKNDQYVNGLENVKQILEQRVTRTTSDNELDSLTFEKKQHELLLSHYDHELKIQKARENARRTEKEKEAERYDSLMHEFVDQTMAEERRQNELRRKLDRLHHSRHLYEALQAKNHEIQNADTQKRRAELLNEIKRKDRRTQHFVQDKQDTVNLCRTIAKSSQDTRQYIRETKENFDEKAKKASLTSAILVTKPKIPVDRRHLQSSLRT